MLKYRFSTIRKKYIKEVINKDIQEIQKYIYARFLEIEIEKGGKRDIDFSII